MHEIHMTLQSLNIKYTCTMYIPFIHYSGIQTFIQKLHFLKHINTKGRFKMTKWFRTPSYL